MMPFYGDPSQFKLAVESVRAQTSSEWRLVVVDDRFPDEEPRRWVESLADPRITIVLNETNLGVSRNFAKSLGLVRNGYFVLMGCDDILDPEYVGTMSRLIARFPSASYFQPGVTVIDKQGKVALPLADRVKTWYRPRGSSPVQMSGEELAISLLRGNWTYFPSICWRTSAVAEYGFRSDYEVVLDLALQLQIVTGGGSLVLVPDRLFAYRRHDGSVSSWTARDGSRFGEEKRFFLDTAREMQVRGWSRAQRVARTHFSSRLNALTKLPGALWSSDRVGSNVLIKHVFGGWS
ncbi:MAG: hypothetical protein QOD05_2261 [Microbacteriaceae bacterium]|jgi:glycosyltransferase involved in cell wall biosynthesis|nr:hypothetical protein [Microbacteriaceae bacterium]